MPREVKETVEPAAEPVNPRARRRRGQGTLFPNWCKGCGLCVEFCPKKVLEQAESGGVSVAHPELCIACRWCELHCPDFAIFVAEVEPSEGEE